MPKPMSLTILEDGPIKLSGDRVSFSFSGAPLEVDAGADVFLCRCGQSANAPFCDGSHARTEFKAETPSGERKEIRVWEGRTIKTYFNPNACMHAFYCKPLKDLRARELAGEDLATEIAGVVESCPSGALSFEASDVTLPETSGLPDVDIQEGGEIRVQRACEINAALLERQEPSRVTLCRCGLSANKPWCDGGHKQREDGFR